MKSFQTHCRVLLALWGLLGVISFVVPAHAEDAKPVALTDKDLTSIAPPKTQAQLADMGDPDGINLKLGYESQLK